MATLTSLLNFSKNALDAAQIALNVTSNNVANQNTAGYARQVASFQSNDSVTIGGLRMGEGVNVTVSSVRDRVLEQRLQQQTQTAGQSGNLVSTLGLVQNIFGVKASSTSAATTTLGSAIDSFYNSFTALEGNASSPASRSTVLTAASSLVDALGSASAQLKSTVTSLDNQVNDTVVQVNSLLSNVADLNKKIALVSPSGDAGPLEDQRQTAITKLSQLIGLDQITTNSNSITLTTTGGAVLVSEGNTFPMQTSQVSGTTHLIAGFNGTDITASISGGSLGGLLQARDVQLPSFQTSLDQLAYGIGVAINTQNAAGLDGNGNAGAALFTFPATSADAASQIALATGVTTASIAAATTSEGATGSGNAVALAALATQNNVGTQSASGFYASYLATIGSAVSKATSDDSVQQAALTQLQSQRDSLSAVSLNEEAANLTQYERSYEAAAKIFTIVDKLFAAALNLGTQTSF